MTDPELKIVYQHVHHLIGFHHGCALTESEITVDDLLKGRYVGELCDVCKEDTNVMIDSIRSKTDLLTKKT